MVSMKVVGVFIRFLINKIELSIDLNNRIIDDLVSHVKSLVNDLDDNLIIIHEQTKE